MTQTRTAPTAHGDVEYETVECTSCENIVAKEQARRIVIGTYHGTDEWSHKPYDEIKMSEYTKGWVCEYCSDEPVQYPSRIVDDGMLGFIFGVMCGIVFLAVLVTAF